MTNGGTVGEMREGSKLTELRQQRPAYLESVLANPNQCARPSSIPRSLNTNENQLLLAMYRSLPITNRLGVIWTLGFGGNEVVVQVFKDAMLSKTNSVLTTVAHRHDLWITARMLGVLAENHDSAFDFLYNAADPITGVMQRT